MKSILYKKEVPAIYEKDITELFINVFSAAPRYESWEYHEALTFLREHYNELALFVLLFNEEKKLVGCCYGNPIENCHIREEILKYTGVVDGIYLSTICIDSNERKKGMGRMLLTKFIDVAMLNKSTIVARTREDAGAIRHLFSNLGFTETGFHKNRVGNREAERLFYVK